MISKKIFPIIILIYFFQYVKERNLNYFNFQKVSKTKVLMLHHPCIKKSLAQARLGQAKRDTSDVDWLLFSVKKCSSGAYTYTGFSYTVDNFYTFWSPSDSKKLQQKHKCQRVVQKLFLYKIRDTKFKSHFYQSWLGIFFGMNI